MNDSNDPYQTIPIQEIKSFGNLTFEKVFSKASISMIVEDVEESKCNPFKTEPQKTIINNSANHNNPEKILVDPIQFFPSFDKIFSPNSSFENLSKKNKESSMIVESLEESSQCNSPLKNKLQNTIIQNSANHNNPEKILVDAEEKINLNITNLASIKSEDGICVKMIAKNEESNNLNDDHHINFFMSC